MGYAARFPVGSTQGLTNGVVVMDPLVEVLVCPEDGLREASSLKKEVKEAALDLVKTFLDISTATGEGLV